MGLPKIQRPRLSSGLWCPGLDLQPIHYQLQVFFECHPRVELGDRIWLCAGYGIFVYLYLMTSQQQILLERITIVPGLMGGKPTIRGMRFPVGDILELLSSGLTDKDILEQHPILEREDIQAALLYASLKMKNTVVIHAA